MKVERSTLITEEPGEIWEPESLPSSPSVAMATILPSADLNEMGANAEERGEVLPSEAQNDSSLEF